MANVLIIDDDELFSEMLSDMITRAGHSACATATIKEGLNQALKTAFDVVFLDIHLPDGNGLDALPIIRETPSCPEVIIITGFGDPGGAELALKSGVWDYIEKPSSIKEMQLPFLRALQYRGEKESRKAPVVLKLEGIIGDSSQIKACYDLVAQAAHSDANVLIAGETGTGKELFALAIHNNSARAGRSFVIVDCASLPQTLVESILFGHEKGAFTGADKAREGLIRQAHGGTLFLDEIGELPASLQKNFLRVLQEHRFRPVGSGREMESDFRLICATNKDLNRLAREGQFREDLLFRIRNLSIDLPPLKGRAEDIKDLLVHYVAKLCGRYRTGVKGFSPEFLDAFLAYEWPGNVRELIGTLEKAVSAAFHEPTLYPKHLPTDIRVTLKKSQLTRESVQTVRDQDELDIAQPLPTLKDYREEGINRSEKQYLETLLRVTGGNIAETCYKSGLSRPRLYALLKKYNITTRPG
jgi:two-component system NtrC family response regulator